MDQVKIFKGCLSQILLAPLLNTLSQIIAALSKMGEIGKMVNFANFQGGNVISFLKKNTAKHLKTLHCCFLLLY